MEKNGIMTNFKYSNLSPMFPYVTAFSGATWNSPNCGRCVRLTSGGRTVHLTVIDQCGPAPGGYDAHFDIAPPAFRELFGDKGVTAGVQSADWQFVASSNCRGNRGNSGGSPPQTPRPASNPRPNPRPAPRPSPAPSNARSNTRCGQNWADANGKCGTPCKNDSPCGGQRCYADLNMAPCNRATDDETSTFYEEETNVEAENDFTEVDAAVADTFEIDDGNFVDDVSMNTEGDIVVNDAAFADAEEDQFVDNYVDSAMVDAAVADTSFETDDGESFDQVFDAAVAGDVNTQQQQTQQQPREATGMEGWMVAILVMFSLTTVLLLAVIVLSVSVLRRH